MVISQMLLMAVGQMVVGQTPVPSTAGTPEPAVDPNRVTPGFLGFLFFVILFVAAAVLYFSLRKQLKRVDFDEAATVIPDEPHAGDDIGVDDPGNSAAL